MNLLTFLLVSAVFKNYLIICNACSLLPGGSTPCFPNAVDYNVNQAQKIKEITYELPPNKEFRYSLQSSNELISLGQHWQEIIGTDLDTVICDHNTTDGAYLEEFQTKLMWHDSGRLRPLVEESNDAFDKRDLDNYFLITKREVWNCRGKENAQTLPLGFLRIVTELLAVWPVKRLSFQDGIEVIFVPTLRVPKFESEGELIPIVREIKYLHPDSYRVLKYEGFLEFHQPEKEGKEEYSLFKEIHWNHPLLKQGNHFKEIFSTTDSQVAESNLQETGTSSHQTGEISKMYLSKDGLQWSAIESPSKTIGTLDEVAICKMNAKDPNLYSPTYVTKWSEKIIVQDFKQALMPINDVCFRFNFVITKHELWTCKTKGSKENFVRSILEYVGSEPFRSVQYTNQINLWKFFLNLRKQTQSIAVRDISYFDKNFEHVSYEGWIEEAKHFMDKILPSKLVPSPSKVPKKQIVNAEIILN